MKNGLRDTFNSDLSDYDVVGIPQDVESEHDVRYQFEYWALSLVEVRPANRGRRGANSSIDGYISFFDNSGKEKHIIAQVKSGQVRRDMIATLRGDHVA